MIKKIADILLSTYLFIATASGCLVLTTSMLVESKLKVTAVAALVFFSTLLMYNFHKVSTRFEGIAFSLPAIIKQLKEFSILTKMMIGSATIGLVISATLVQTITLLALIPLTLITFAYSVPLLKLKGKKKRLREIFLVKITTLSLIWSLATVTLPMIDSGTAVFSSSSILIFTGRFLFLFAICIPFEIRDMEQEKKWGNTTLPQRIGIKMCKVTGLVAILIFMILVCIQFGFSSDQSKHFITFPLCIAAFVAAFLVLNANQHRSKYYFRIFVDGTMQLQFILLILFKSFG